MAKKIVCRDAGFDCDFEVVAETADEVIDFARQHAEQTHGLSVTRTDLEAHVQGA